eukprot:scaffold35837_cov30-Tisochrysis_lutea.AAC.4
MLLTLVALTRFFYFLPLFCLAAIVIASVTNLVDIAEARYLWNVKKSDFALWMVAFLGTLFLGVQASCLVQRRNVHTLNTLRRRRRRPSTPAKARNCCAREISL